MEMPWRLVEGKISFPTLSELHSIDSIWNNLTFQLPSMDLCIFQSSSVWPSKVDWKLLKRFSLEYLLHTVYYLFMPQPDLGMLIDRLYLQLSFTPQQKKKMASLYRKALSHFSHFSHSHLPECFFFRLINKPNVSITKSECCVTLIPSRREQFMFRRWLFTLQAKFGDETIKQVLGPN